jgi:acyl carrier protein
MAGEEPTVRSGKELRRGTARDRQYPIQKTDMIGYMSPWDRESIIGVICQCLRDLRESRGEEVGLATSPEADLTNDYGLSSIDVLHLVIASEERIGRSLSLAGMFEAGEFKRMLTVTALADALLLQLNGSDSGASPGRD